MNKNDKIINIIIKDNNENTLYFESIQYKQNKYRNLDEIFEYISKKYNIKSNRYYDYDYITRRNITFKKAKQSNDYIDWEIDFYNLDLQKAFSLNNNKPLTVICIDKPYGIGGFCIQEVIELIEFILKVIRFLTKKIMIQLDPYKEFNRYYLRVDREFINSVILCSATWKEDFISKDNFKNKKSIENSIMKKLGYKKCKKIWTLDPMKSKYYIYRIDRE